MIAKMEKHLCWDCAKAVDMSCAAYEGITSIIEENFEDIKIYFQVKECKNYIPDKN